MAFVGSVNDRIRKYLWDIAPLLEGRTIKVGCSGNFTVEQILAKRTSKTRIYGNDVSLYTAVIGWALVREPGHRLEVAEEDYAFLREFMDTSGRRASAVMCLFEMLKFDRRKNAYQQGQWDGFRAAFPALVEKTRKRNEEIIKCVKMEQFTMVDVHDYFDDLSPDDIAVGFLPTYVGGYERLYRRLEEVLSWDAPSYEMLTDERHEATIQKMQKANYIYISDKLREDMPCVCIAEVSRLKPVYLYSNLDVPVHYYRRTMNTKWCKVPRHDPGFEFTPDTALSLFPITAPEMNHARALYLGKNIVPADAPYNYAVLADGKAVGFVSADRSKFGEGLYVMADFCVPDLHPRLSKLVLLCLQSHEFRRQIEERAVRSMPSMTTTAFTSKPVSMKYRGVFRLSKRGEGFLNYESELGLHTLQEGLGIWLNKYAK